MPKIAQMRIVQSISSSLTIVVWLTVPLITTTPRLFNVNVFPVLRAVSSVLGELSMTVRNVILLVEHIITSKLAIVPVILTAILENSLKTLIKHVSFVLLFVPHAPVYQYANPVKV